MAMTIEEKKERLELRRAARKALKDQARIDAEKAQKPVDSITINIEWKHSRTWGNNPHTSGLVRFKDGTCYDVPNFTASGCGYDKESTVIADVFNAFLKYKLWNLTTETVKGGHGTGDSGPAPYGINRYNNESRSYGAGIGTNCYYKIAEYIGGTFRNLSSGKSFDVFEYKDGV
jgi:hypothetical protein